MNTNPACEKHVEDNLSARSLDALHPDERRLVVALCAVPGAAPEVVAELVVAIRQLSALASNPEFANLTDGERNEALALFVSGKSLSDVKAYLRGLRARADVGQPSAKNPKSGLGSGA